MKRDKILIALWRFPYPAIDGTRYKILHNIVESLYHDFDIEFFIVSVEPVEKEHIEYLEKNFGKVHLFKYSKIRFLKNMLFGFFSKLPMQVCGYFFSDAYEWIKKHANDYDAYYVHEIRMSEYFLDTVSEKEKIIFDFNDAISLNYSEAKKFTKFPMSMFYSIEGKRIKQYESFVLKSFNHFNVVSVFDKKYLIRDSGVQEEGEIDFVSIPHAVAFSEFENVPKKPAFFFLGNLSYAPNSDAVKFFLENIWKDIKRDHPLVEFYIIGKGENKCKKYHHLDGVHFLGFVPDIKKIVSECVCMVAPLRFGAGVPSKIIEIMSLGVPVITTPVSAQGINGLLDKENIYLIDEKDTRDWVTTIITLLNNSDLAENVGQNGKKLIRETHEISRVQRLWKSFFERVISE